MQFSKWKIGAVALVCMLLPGSVHAQIVKNERLLSFEEKQVPAFVTTAAGSQLGISDEHYRDGDHSLSWTFEPGARLSSRRMASYKAVLRGCPLGVVPARIGASLYIASSCIFALPKQPKWWQAITYQF